MLHLKTWHCDFLFYFENFERFERKKKNEFNLFHVLCFPNNKINDFNDVDIFDNEDRYNKFTSSYFYNYGKKKNFKEANFIIDSMNLTNLSIKDR